MPSPNVTAEQATILVDRIRSWAKELGFAEARIADIHLGDAEHKLQQWLEAGFHGEMEYMAAHGEKRARPAELIPGTVRVISVRMDYLPRDTADNWREREEARQSDAHAAVVSVYARGRDYHKILLSRLQKLTEKITAEIGSFGFRVFTDSAPGPNKNVISLDEDDKQLIKSVKSINDQLLENIKPKSKPTKKFIKAILKEANTEKITKLLNEYKIK